MSDTSESTDVSRRTLLRKGAIAGTILTGVTTVSGTVASDPGRGRGRENGNLVSHVASHGHYSYFPAGPSTWGRSQNPFDIQQEDMRWMAEPAGRGIRCRIENLPTPFRNAGFDVHLGPLGSIEEISVQSRTIQTNWSGTGGNAMLVGALYFDANDNGEFFAWTDARGNTEIWDGFGGDTERGLARPASGSFTIDDSTPLPVFAADPMDPPTVGEINDGMAIAGVDASTETALYLGVASPSGESAGTEEIVVESMNVKRA